MVITPGIKKKSNAIRTKTAALEQRQMPIKTGADVG
jgi:hypothetical protein